MTFTQPSSTGLTNFSVLAITVLMAVLYGCANQVAPTGGEKDIQPPSVLKALPLNGSTQFNSSDIHITFDEYVTLQDATTQIYISPVPPSKPEYKVRNKQVSIHFNDTLSPNTTYAVFFGNSIRDLNEGNILLNYSYVFSTGLYIDSLFIKGFVTRATDNTPVSSAVVALYRATDDSVIYKQRPDYFARCTKDGQFEIRNIKEHVYKVVAFEDNNQNLKYDDEEPIAFTDSLLPVRDTTTVVSLHLFKPKRKVNTLLSSRQMGLGRIMLAFANPVADLQIQLVHTDQKPWNIIYNETHDTCTMLVSPMIKDSLRFIVFDAGFRDTATVLFKSSGIRSTNKDTLSTYNSKPSRNNLSNDKKKLILFYGMELSLIPQELVDSLYQTALSLKTPEGKTIPAQLSINYHKRTHEQYLYLSASLLPDQQYALSIPRSSWRYKNGQWNDSIYLDFYYTDETATGNINFTVSGTETNQSYLMELRNAEQELVFDSRFDADKTFTIRHLAPGVYRARVVVDTNKNGQYDTGDYYNKRQPETILQYAKEITVRANWDLELDLSLKRIEIK